tara:strand:- start:6681 stop:8891 length:2211 start_codon:yes stop_codon:yes gene_type:complete
LKSKFLKVILVFVVSLILVFAGTLVYISSQIDPEKIKKIAIKTIESNLDNTQATIESIDYSLGQKIKFNVTNLELTQSNSSIVKVEKIKVFLPIVSILTNGGVVDVNLSNSIINIINDEQGLNLQKMIKADSSNTSSKSVKFEIPKFLEKSKINLKVNDTQVNYTELGDTSSFDIKKVSLKNINLKKTTAFEVSTKVNLNRENLQLRTNITLVGELPINDLLNNNTAKLDVMIQVEDTAYNEFKIGKSKHRGSVIYKKPDFIELNFRNEIDNVGSGELNAIYSSEKLNVKKVDFLVNAQNVISVLNLKDNLVQNDIALDGLDVSIKGSAQIDIQKMYIAPLIVIKSAKKFNLKVQNNELIPDFKINLVKDSLEVSANTSFLDTGVATIELQTKVNYQKPQDLSPISINVDVKNLSHKLERISLVTSTDKEVIEETTPVEPLDLSFAQKIPELDISFLLSDSKINDLPVNVETKLDYKKNTFSFKNFLINFPEAGKINSNNLKVKLDENTIRTSGQIITDLNLVYFESFLPIEIKRVKGIMQSNIKVNADYSTALNYKAEGTLNIKNGTIEDFNLKNFLGPILKQYSFLKSQAKKDNEVTTSFDSISSSLQMDNKQINIKKLNVQGTNKEFSIDGEGIIKLQAQQKSKMTMSVRVAQYEKDLQRETGRRTIPVLLEGINFALLPDINYTTGKLFTRAKKTKTKQIKKDINKKIKAEEKKLKKDLEDKAKKLLKGIKL